MQFLIIVLGIALIASLAFNFGLIGGNKPLPSNANNNNLPSPTTRADRRDDDATRASKAESELEKKRKELDEVKKAQAELKDELKTAKKKLHDQKEAGKGDDDLVKARQEVERQASVQLETTRAELANALSEMQRMRSEGEGRGRRPAAPAPKPAAAEGEVVAAAPKPVEEKREVVIQRVIRELSESEKEKMQTLERQAASDKKKAIELAAELRSVKGKIDREKRDAKRIYEEGRLARDKFRAIETRLNRTLLENDMVKRAISELEKKTGQHAEHAMPTSEELAESDAKMKAKHAAEDHATEEAQKKLEAAEVAAEQAQTPVENAAVVAAATPAPEAAAPVVPSA